MVNWQVQKIFLKSVAFGQVRFVIFSVYPFNAFVRFDDYSFFYPMSFSYEQYTYLNIYGKCLNSQSCKVN